MPASSGRGGYILERRRRRLDSATSAAAAAFRLVQSSDAHVSFSCNISQSIFIYTYVCVYYKKLVFFFFGEVNGRAIVSDDAIQGLFLVFDLIVVYKFLVFSTSRVSVLDGLCWLLFFW